MDRAMDPVTVNIVTQLNRKHMEEMQQIEFAARVTKD